MYSEFFGFVFTLMASYFFISKKVDNPSYRIVGFFLYSISSVFVIIYSLYIESVFMVSIQIIYIFMNMYGIVNNIKMKKLESDSCSECNTNK